MCYNVLCDKYCSRQLYGYSPRWSLRWDHRQRLILDEICNYNADIVCLQEVETCEFFDTFSLELKRHGYLGIFSPKSRAKTMHKDDSKNVDGCAIFWKQDRFMLLEEHLIEFNQLAIKNSGGDEDILNRVMTKDNIALAAVFKTIVPSNDLNNIDEDSGEKIVVCNAHMHWDPEFSDVKMIQSFLLTTELDRITRQHSTNPQKMPVIMCGDYNSLPDSGVAEFIQKGKVCLNHPEFKKLQYNRKLTKMNPKNGELRYDDQFLRHPFQFKKAYTAQHLPYTNYTYDFRGIIDYIYHTSHLKTLGVLGGIDENWLKSVPGFPNPVIPSDHLSLLTEFELTQERKTSL